MIQVEGYFEDKVCPDCVEELKQLTKRIGNHKRSVLQCPKCGYNITVSSIILDEFNKIDEFNEVKKLINTNKFDEED